MSAKLFVCRPSWLLFTCARCRRARVALDDEQITHVEEALQWLGLRSHRWVEKTSRGELPALRIDGRVIFGTEQIVHFTQTRTLPEPPAAT
jgi:hypothetical protein